MAQVRHLRDHLDPKVSAKELSQCLRGLGVNLSRETIAQYERDETRASKLKLQDAVALALGVPLSRLLTPPEPYERMAVTPNFETYAGSVRMWLDGGWSVSRATDADYLPIRCKNAEDARGRYFAERLPGA